MMTFRLAVAVTDDNCVAVLKKPIANGDFALAAALDYWSDLHVLGVDFQLVSLGSECLCFGRMRRRLCLRLQLVEHQLSFALARLFVRHHTMPFTFGSSARQKFGSPRLLPA